LAPTCGFVASLEVGLGATVDTLQIEYPNIQASSQDKEKGMHPCTDMSPATPNPASLLRLAPALPRAPRLQTPPPCLGGLRCCHLSHDSRPRLPVREGSSVAMCPTTPDSASLLERVRCYHVSHISGPCLPAQLVGGALMLSRVPRLRGSWALRIKKGLATTICGKAHVFLRHACMLSRRLQDVRADSIIMICKSCIHVLQCCAT
jgi:hypothetical protein